MENFRYLCGVTSLVYEKDSCVGCGSCAIVCPHGVFVMNDKKARINALGGEKKEKTLQLSE